MRDALGKTGWTEQLHRFLVPDEQAEQMVTPESLAYIVSSRYKLMFGDTIDAQTAERYGLVNRVVPHADLLATAQRWAQRLVQGPAFAISMTISAEAMPLAIAPVL